MSANLIEFEPPAHDIASVIPGWLKQNERCLLWRAESKPNKAKPSKVPYYTNGRKRNGKLGSPEDLAQLASFDDAYNVYLGNPDRWAGIGLALIDGDNVAAVDLDNIILDGRIVKDDLVLRRMLREAGNQNCYIESSPSGRGLRIIGTISESFPAITKPYEAYCRDRYVTITGQNPVNPSSWGNIEPVIEILRASQPSQSKPSANDPRSALSDAIGGGSNPMPETRENIERVQSALGALDPDMGYPEWRNVLFALRSLEWPCAETIARTWSAGGDPNEPRASKYDADEFDNLWAKAQPGGGITIGTLFHMAREAGWNPPAPAGANLADNSGAKDILNGRYFAALHRNRLLRVAEKGNILRFGETGWHPTDPGAEYQAAIEVVNEISSLAQHRLSEGKQDESRELQRHKVWSSTEARLRAMWELGWSEPGMSVKATLLDADPNLLGVRNGIVDLRSRTLLKPRPEILVTKRAAPAFDPSAQCPAFDRFLNDIQPDHTVQRLLQQVCGLVLLGEVLEQRLFFFYGLGANGKSTLIETVAWVLGDYACRIQTETLMRHHRSPQGHDADLAVLKGSRLAYCNEVGEGQRLDPSRTKDLTGGDTISARIPYGREAMTFSPSHTLIMIGNHQPEITDMTHGMWRRLVLIGFDQEIPPNQRDPYLPNKLKQEGSGILNWMLRGLADYLTHGLALPQAVVSATDIYRDEQDLLGQWLDDCCAVRTGAKESKSKAYNSYHSWATERGHRPLSQKRLTQQLKERGHKLDLGKRHYLGFELARDASSSGGVSADL